MPLSTKLEPAHKTSERALCFAGTLSKEVSHPSGLSVAAQLAARVRSLASFSLPGPDGTVCYHVCELDQRVVVRVDLPESGDLIARFTTFVEEPASEADDAWKASAPSPLVVEGVDGQGRRAVIRAFSGGMFPEMLTLDVGGEAADFRGPDEGIGEASLYESDLASTRDYGALVANLEAELREAIGVWPRLWPDRESKGLRD